MPKSDLLSPARKDYSKASLVIFLDIDNTLFISNYQKDVLYTGLSSMRWRAFLTAIKRQHPEAIVGIVTNKDRGTSFSRKPNVYNGMPPFEEKEIIARYDELCRILFGMPSHRGAPIDRRQSLMDLLNPDFIYFLDQGAHGTKSAAMEHALREHLGRDFDPQKLWIFDDCPNVWDDITRHKKKFNLIRIPEEMYEIPVNKYFSLDLPLKVRLEKACVQFMLKALETLQINPSQKELDQIIKRDYPDSSLTPVYTRPDQIRTPEHKEYKQTTDRRTKINPLIFGTTPENNEELELENLMENHGAKDFENQPARHHYTLLIDKRSLGFVQQPDKDKVEIFSHLPEADAALQEIYWGKETLKEIINKESLRNYTLSMVVTGGLFFTAGLCTMLYGKFAWNRTTSAGLITACSGLFAALHPLCCPQKYTRSLQSLTCLKYPSLEEGDDQSTNMAYKIINMADSINSYFCSIQIDRNEDCRTVFKKLDQAEKLILDYKKRGEKKLGREVLDGLNILGIFAHSIKRPVLEYLISDDEDIHALVPKAL